MAAIESMTTATPCNMPDVGTLPRLAAREIGIVVAIQVALLTAFAGRSPFHRDRNDELDCRTKELAVVNW
jgi:hypothetical protein